MWTAECGISKPSGVAQPARRARASCVVLVIVIVIVIVIDTPARGLLRLSGKGAPSEARTEHRADAAMFNTSSTITSTSADGASRVDVAPGPPLSKEIDISKSLGEGGRIDLDLPPKATSRPIGPFQVPVSTPPDAPWGFEIWLKTNAVFPLSVKMDAVEKDGEPWVYESFPFKHLRPDSWNRLVIPFVWFGPLTWARVDGRLDRANLRSLTLRFRNADAKAPGKGSIWIGSLRLLDARKPVGCTPQDGFMLMDLRQAYDSDGVAFAANPLDGDFDTGEWEHRALPAESFPKGPVATYLGVPFRMPDVADGQDNHIRCNGQMLELEQEARYSALYFLCTGKFGPQVGDVTLIYADGTRQKVLLHVSDWTNGPLYGDQIAIEFPRTYRDKEIEQRRSKLYLQSVRVDRARTLRAVELPQNDYLKVFAASLCSIEEPPRAGTLESRPLDEALPRYSMKTLDELHFDEPAKSAGVFGGYLRREPHRMKLEEPTLNGFLTVAGEAEGLVYIQPVHRLIWQAFREDGSPLELGSLLARSQVQLGNERLGTLQTDLLDWTCIRQSCVLTGKTEPLLTVYGSRAWPAVLYETPLMTFCWHDPAINAGTRLTFETEQGCVDHAVNAGATFAAPAAPWILLWRAEGFEKGFDVPLLLTLEHKPIKIEVAPGKDKGLDLVFEFSREAGRLSVMPLFGIRRIPSEETRAWAAHGLPENVAALCRTWASRLQCYPIAVDEKAEIDEDKETVTIRNKFSYQRFESEWNYPSSTVSLVPPVVALARDNGYDVEILSAATREDCDTFWGPMLLTDSDTTSYRIRLPRCVSHMLVPGRTTGAPLPQTIEDELRKLISEDVSPSARGSRVTPDTCGDLAELRALAPSRLVVGEAVDCKAYCRAVVEDTMRDGNLKVDKEPLTGQYYLMDDRFWAKDTSFDKEWAIGFMLQGLWNYAYYFDDAAFLSERWDHIRGLYRYYQIVFDWATCSTFTMAEGVGANSDGVRIAWEGMLAMARMARLVDDEKTYEEACVRCAKQMLSLYASWFGPQWAAGHDYVTSANRRAPRDKAELRFAPDNTWLETRTCNVSHCEDFFQVTHAFYTFNLAHLLHLHDSGLDELRLRDWFYVRIPELHPQWWDGNAWCKGSERYYGSDHAMAHLIARALLFREDTGRLYDWYRGCMGDTRASREWYKPNRWAPSVLTAFATASAPMVVAPVSMFSVSRNEFAATEGIQHLILVGKRQGNDRVFIRCWKIPVQSVQVNGKSQSIAYDPRTDYLTIGIEAVPGQSTDICVQYEVPKKEGTGK